MLLVADINPNVAAGLLAVILILAGLAIIALSHKASPAILATVFWWLGLLVAILGAVLLLAPIIAWIAAQLRAMLGL